MILIFTCTSSLADPGAGFARREQYKNATNLGNPNDASEFIDLKADSNKLQSMRDSSLVDEGQGMLNSEAGLFLQNSEKSKIEAMDRYKINSDNPLIKNSLQIEENPMSKTGGSSLSSSTQQQKIKIEKACMEGVDFEVDIGLELVLDCYEEEYEEWSKYTDRSVQIDGDTVFQRGRHLGFTEKWGKGRFGWHIEQNVPEWRKILSNIYNIPDDQMGPSVEFPYGSRGVQQIGGAPTHWVEHKLKVFDLYAFTYYVREKLKKKRFIERGEYWQVTNAGIEQLTKCNECYEVRRICTKSGVKKFFDKYEVSRPCWYEKVTYQCTSEPKNGCKHLFDQNCTIKSSTCEERVGGICLKWKRIMECGGIRKSERFSLSNSPIYCLGGNCHEPVLEENQDLANVAYLAATNEAKKDCIKGSNGLCKNPITVFPGRPSGCKSVITKGIDCCSSMKGWAKNMNLCSCSGAEKGLAMERERGKCHAVGTHCSRRDPVFRSVCIEKKTNFCCFSSKLARILQEQARVQLGIGWGSAESPNCRPLTLEEFTRIDFTKIDFEELFDDVLKKGKQNMSKSFPTLKPGEVPAIQKEHMKSERGNR